jgi:tetratricopeptide (TPR) repeat protein
MHRLRLSRLVSARCLAVLALLAGIALPLTVRAHADLILQLEELTKLIEKDPRNVELFFRRGELHRVHLDWPAAQADFDHILKIDPANRQVDFAKGRLMADSNWPLSAKAYLDRFIAGHPRHAEAYTTRARVHTRLNLHLASADDYAAAIRLSPDPGPELFIERAQTLAAQSPQYVTKALQGLDEGVQRIGPLVTLQLLAIDLELQRTNYNGALERVDAVAQRSPRKETWLTRRGEILEKAGRPAEARQAYEAALAALGTLPPVRRNVPAMAQLEKRLRTQLEALKVTPVQ